MTDALTLRVRALELSLAALQQSLAVTDAKIKPPSIINIQFAGETLPAGPKVKGLGAVPIGKPVLLWAVLPWRITSSFVNSQWFANGVQVPNSATVGVSASSAGAQPISMMNVFTGTFTAAPQLSLYSGVATVIDAWMVGGLAWI